MKHITASQMYLVGCTTCTAFFICNETLIHAKIWRRIMYTFRSVWSCVCFSFIVFWVIRRRKFAIVMVTSGWSMKCFGGWIAYCTKSELRCVFVKHTVWKVMKRWTCYLDKRENDCRKKTVNGINLYKFFFNNPQSAWWQLFKMVCIFVLIRSVIDFLYYLMSTALIFCR